MRTLILCSLFAFGFNLTSGEANNVEISLIYTQHANNTYSLKATVADEEEEEPISGMKILFAANINGVSLSLGSAVTNKEGISIFRGDLPDLRAKGHQFEFTALFEGNDQFEENQVELEIVDAQLQLKTEIIDSVNTVFVSLSRWDEDGNSLPIGDENIYLFVPRMYSLLPISEAYTSETGEDEVEFPNDIPGGPNGELVIIGKLDEHDEYGTIESQSETTWGLPVSLDVNRLPRALWSPDAPLWMLITFIILMTGVWGHYFWIAYTLFSIKKLEDKNAPISYRE
ncbi:MAG: hypothetical protein RIB47_03515 [Cyclobacteriaceae bacterium]